MSKKINKIIDETLALQLQEKEIKNKISKNKQLIQDYFENQLSGENCVETSVAKATKIESAYITYKGFPLEKNLKDNGKKNLVNKVIKKKYEIVDIQAFLDLIKLTHISPFTIKSHIQVHREVDGQAVKRLFETGEITKEDLEGTFDSKIVKSIRLSEINTRG